MSQAQQVVKNTAGLGAARLIDRLGSLVVAVLISRELHAAGLGVYATAIAFFALIAVAGDMGTTNLLIREISKDRSKTNAYLVHAGSMAAVISIALMPIVWLAVPHLGYSADLRTGVQVIVLAVLPGTLKAIQEAVLVAHQRAEFTTIVTAAASGATVLASAFLLMEGRGVVSLLVAYVGIQYAVALAYFVIINRYVQRIRGHFERAFARRLVSEIKAFAGSSLLAAAFARPEIIILSLVASETQVGFYSAALKIVDLWQFIPQTFMINVFPVLSRSFHARDGKGQRIQDLAMKYLLAVGLPISVGLALAADGIVRTAYGETFGEAALLLRILAVNMTIYCVHSVLWRVLAARGEQGTVLRIQLATILPRLAGGYVLIERFAAVGAAIITPAILIFHTVLLAASVRRDGTAVPILRSAWRFLAAAAIMGLVVAPLGSSMGLWAFVLVAAFVYAAVLLALRAFSREDIAAFRSVLPFRLARSG